MAYYLDSSAVVKYYVAEPGSTWVRQRIDEEDVILLCEITIAEVAAALGILDRLGRIRPRHRRDFWERFERDCAERYDMTPIGREAVYVAADLCARHPLKAYDAVQLAGCLSLRDPLAERGIPLVFISADSTLVAAAKNEGLAVDNPFWHTDLDSPAVQTS